MLKYSTSMAERLSYQETCQRLEEVFKPEVKPTLLDNYNNTILNVADRLAPYAMKLAEERIFYLPGAIKRSKDFTERGMHLVFAFIKHTGQGDIIPAVKVSEEVCSALGLEGSDFTVALSMETGDQGEVVQRLSRVFKKIAYQHGVNLVPVSRAEDKEQPDFLAHRRPEDKQHVLGGKNRAKGFFIEGGMKAGRRIVDIRTDNLGNKIEVRRNERYGLQGLNKPTSKIKARQFSSYLYGLEKDGGYAILPVVLGGGYRLLDPESKKKIGILPILAVMGFYPNNILRADVGMPITNQRIHEDLGEEIHYIKLYDYLLNIGASMTPYEWQGDYKNVILM